MKKKFGFTLIELLVVIIIIAIINIIVVPIILDVIEDAAFIRSKISVKWY